MLWIEADIVIGRGVGRGLSVWIIRSLKGRAGGLNSPECRLVPDLVIVTGLENSG